MTAMVGKRVLSNLLLTLILAPKRILKSQNFRKTKATRKPGLLTQIKKHRLKFCLYHKD